MWGSILGLPTGDIRSFDYSSYYGLGLMAQLWYRVPQIDLNDIGHCLGPCGT